jgi:hypothetical protein
MGTHVTTRRFLALTAAAVSTIALSSLPALAENGDCRVIREAVPATETEPAVEEVSVCREDAFLVGTAAPLANVEAAGGTLPSWDTAAPAGATTSRYASIAPVDMMQSSPSTRPTFSGTYTGVLDNIAIDLFVSSPVYQAAGIGMANYHRLTIDGVVVWENSGDDPEIDIPILPVDDTTGKISYAFSDLFGALEAQGIANASDTEHTIEFSTANIYWGDGNFTVNFGSEEAPSGLIFNKETNSKGRIVGYTDIGTF